MSTLESKIQSAIMSYLTNQGLMAFRVNNAPVWDTHLNGGYGAYRTQGKWAAPGLSDVLLILPPYGTLVGCEIKSLKGKLSADQVLFKKRLERNGGKYYVLRSVEEAKTMLVALGITSLDL